MTKQIITIELEDVDTWIETVHQNILAYGSEQEKNDWQWSQDHVDDSDKATRVKAMKLYDDLLGKFGEEA